MASKPTNLRNEGMLETGIKLIPGEHKHTALTHHRVPVPRDKAATSSQQRHMTTRHRVSLTPRTRALRRGVSRRGREFLFTLELLNGHNPRLHPCTQRTRRGTVTPLLFIEGPMRRPTRMAFRHLGLMSGGVSLKDERRRKETR